MITKTTATTVSEPQQEQFQAGKESLAPRIFALFRKIAEDPITEIGGRTIWSDNLGNLPDGDDINLVEVTRCTTTVQALLVALFGPKTSRSITSMWSLSNATRLSANPGYLKQVYDDIEKRGDSLKANPSSSFYAYMMGFFRNPKPKTPDASSHAFLVIQYVGNEGEVYYRLFQSFLEHFTLKEDLDRESNFFSQKQFQVFLTGFEEAFVSDLWTTELETFHTKFFHVQSSLTIGGQNPYLDTGPLVCAKPFSFEDVEKNEGEFAALKETQLFKRIISNVIL